jgi:hypothetical protein
MVVGFFGAAQPEYKCHHLRLAAGEEFERLRGLTAGDKRRQPLNNEVSRY